jgi:DNA damage-inducible protein 1
MYCCCCCYLFHRLPNKTSRFILSPSYSIRSFTFIYFHFQGGIQSALSATSKFHEAKQMEDRLTQNPDDASARAFFQNRDRLKRVAEQRDHVYEEYPEAFASVIMLYINAKINGHHIQAFCDSGAQSTIISHELAVACGLGEWIDESMAGLAVGVGTRKIIGRLHSVQLQIGDMYFPCTVTVLADPGPNDPASKMGFLLGLDMMKRHLCVLDLQAGCLKFRLAGDDQYLETPFLHEKDLDQEKGGTKGFDAAKSNADNEKE